MKIKEWLQNLFHFNKQERNGVFVLCIIIGSLVIVKLCLPLFSSNKDKVQFITINYSSNSQEEKTNSTGNVMHESEKEIVNDAVSSERFVFNPNTIGAEDAQKLGLSKKLSNTLINFRNKGGKFYKPEDLKKLYGLTPKLFEELEAYILIPNANKEYTTKFKKDTVYQKSYSKPSYEKKVFIKEAIEINTADSLSIVYLKGIGPSFTKRIIKYRTLLGGFHSMNQLKEIYGMTDSLYLNLTSQIKLDKNNIAKIPINVIDVATLRKHPYFPYASAQTVINFRSKHGKLNEQDVKSLGIFNEEKLKLILPYLSY
jgi:DNA uptake protein ComE-like DNA-binding protein